MVLKELKLEDAEKISLQINAKLEPHCEKLEVAGSIRRKKPIVHDVDFVVVTQDSGWQRISDELRKMKTKNICAGAAVIKTLYPLANDYFQVDFYRAEPSTFGIHKLVRTGSAEHNMWLAGYANSKGMRLQYSRGLMKDGQAVAGEEERGVFEALSLPCPEPEKREVIDGKPIWL